MEKGPHYTPGQILTIGVVYRRIYPDANSYDVVEQRPTRQVFDKRKDEHLSTGLSELTTPEEMLAGREGFGLCEVDIEILVNLKLEARYEPSEKEGPAHVAIRGQLSGTVRHQIAKAARMVVVPQLKQRRPEP